MTKEIAIRMGANLGFIEKIILTDGTVVENMHVLYHAPIPNEEQFGMIFFATIFKEPKTKAGRRAVAISPEVVKSLKAHKTEQKKEKMAMGEAYEDNDLVCCLQNGLPIVPSTVTKRFQEVTEGAGFKVTFHQLRHAHASYLLQQGEHPKVVSERLGHSNISMTMDLYSHIAPTLQQEAADRLDGILFKK